MATTAFQHRAGTLTRLANWLGRTSARGWHKTGTALVSAGLPLKAANGVVFVLKLAIVGALLYFAFVLALVMLFAVAGAWIIRNGEHVEEDEPEWDYGISGFGLYQNGVRVDIYDPSDPNGED